MTYHATGIVLRREDRREVDRFYVIYTREHGKLMAVGRGTRKILSKLGPHLEPYSAVDLFLARGRRHETLCGASLSRSSEPLARESERFAAAAFAVEAFDQLVKWGAPDEDLYDLLDGFLAEAAVSPLPEIPRRLAGYLWRFMDRMGYGPRLGACVSCDRDPLAVGALFLPASGQIVCPSCRPHERDLAGAEPLPKEGLAELRSVFDGAGEAAHPAVLRAAHAFLEAHLDRPLLSASAIRITMTA